jgi:hypothetical protein
MVAPRGPVLRAEDDMDVVPFQRLAEKLAGTSL